MDNNETGLRIQWFPGHMAKTRRIMKENLKHVDVVVELRDARIPYSSANPEIEKLVENKPRVILLNKSDLADKNVTDYWISYYKNQSIPTLAVDCRSGKGLNVFPDLVKGAVAEIIQRRNDRGMVGAAIRMMIVGVPNVGKSSLINRMAGGRRTQVEDRPGVTVRKQWIKVTGGMELLDMPGVLWPKFEDLIVGENLAFTGAVKDDIMDTDLLAIHLITRLQNEYPQLLETRYTFTKDETEGLGGADLVELLGKKRGMLISGGEIDLERASLTLLDEFRSGTLGRVSLERPPKQVEQ